MVMEFEFVWLQVGYPLTVLQLLEGWCILGALGNARNNIFWKLFLMAIFGYLHHINIIPETC